MQVDLLPLLNKCKGRSRRGRCTTDPRGGYVSKRDNRDGCCIGRRCPTLQLRKIISRRQCSDCTPEELVPVEIPETGALDPGATVQAGALTARVAEISGA